MGALPAHPLAGPWLWAGAATNTAFAGPWGISYAANLTPDQNTGLGIWTEEMFVKAMRTGRHMGSSREILPPMPWPALRNATDEDLKAIYAYPAVAEADHQPCARRAAAGCHRGHALRFPMMQTLLFLALRATHVLCAAVWIGSTVYISLLLTPAVEDAGPVGGQIMMRLDRRGLHTYMAVMAMTTIASGAYLLWRFTGGFDPGVVATHAGMAFATGGLRGSSPASSARRSSAAAARR